jgi:DNA-binding NarL/FixJ family response regulator
MFRDVSRGIESNQYPAKIRVLLVDDHASFRELLATILGLEVDISVRAEAGTVAEAAQHLDDIDVAIVDLGLPDAHGTELIALIQDSHPDIRVLVLTGTDRRLDIARSIEAGAAGVLSKAVAVYEIVDATRRIYLGEFLHSPVETVELLRLSEVERQHDREKLALRSRLGPDEMRVLEALCHGMSDKEIAEKLGLDPEEERSLMSGVLTNLGVQTPLQAAISAIRAGLVEVTSE